MKRCQKELIGGVVKKLRKEVDDEPNNDIKTRHKKNKFQ